MCCMGALLNSSESGEITDELIEAATRELPDTTTSAPNAHTTRPASTTARAANGQPELTNTAPRQPTRLTEGGGTSSPSHRNRRITCNERGHTHVHWAALDTQTKALQERYKHVESSQVRQGGRENSPAGLPARVQIPVPPSATSRLLFKVLGRVRLRFLVGSPFRLACYFFHWDRGRSSKGVWRRHLILDFFCSNLAVALGLVDGLGLVNVISLYLNLVKKL
jgi:hypothetical protein